MKTNLHLYISNPEEFSNGELDWCFTVRTDKDWTDTYQPTWVYVCPIAVDIEKHVKTNDVIDAAIKDLDECIQSTLAAAEVRAQGYRVRRQNLLALEAPDA